MNDLSPQQFADMSDLLVALGLSEPSGGFNEAWLRNPDVYLKQILSNDDQREAILQFVDSIDEEMLQQDSEGRDWISLFTQSVDGKGEVSFSLVLDDDPADLPQQVHLFLGVKFSTKAPLALSDSRLVIPLFRVAKEGEAGTISPELLGHKGGKISLGTDVELTPAAPAPGEAGLQSLGVNVSIPTAASDGDPTVGLALGGFQLPGETTPRDLNLALSEPDELRAAGLDLIFSLIQAQLGSNTGVQMAALGDLLGLTSTSAIPAFPVTELIDNGPIALADWLSQCLGDQSARGDWLTALAQLFGASATPQGIDLPLGASTVLHLGCTSVPGPAGRPLVTFSCGFKLEQGDVSTAIACDFLKLDLSDGSALAVPALKALATIDLPTLPSPDIAIERLVVGFALDEDRHPLFVLELAQAQVFDTFHERLDLTNPDALADAAGQAVGDLLAPVLAQLDGFGDLISVILGWQAPTGASAAYPTTGLIEFLADPLGKLTQHWKAVFAGAPQDLLLTFSAVRELVTGDATLSAVTGAGTADDPWLLPLEALVNLSIWRDDDGVILIALRLRKSVDNLGERCTVIETRVSVVLVALDLDERACVFLPAIELSAVGRARGGGRLTSELGAIQLGFDHVGILAKWEPDAGLVVRPSAPNPSLGFDGILVPFALPSFDQSLEDILENLAQENWDAIERIVGLISRTIDVPWLSEIVAALGWLPDAPVLGDSPPHRLPLAALVADAQSAIEAWVANLIADVEEDLSSRLQPLAKFLAGDLDNGLVVEGTGTIEDPLKVGLSGPSGQPKLAAWREPDAPLPLPDVSAVRALRKWRPGAAGLSPEALARAIMQELPGIVSPVGGALSAENFLKAFTSLAGQLSGSDGLLRPTLTPLAGVQVHVVEDILAGQLLERLDLEALLGAQPAKRVIVRAMGAGASLTGLGDNANIFDLREAAVMPQLSRLCLMQQASTM